MAYYEGLSCPVCTQAFVSGDDIVVCPQCGLPHHRACWKSIGRCYAQDKHGTAEQWSRDGARAQATPPTTSNVCAKCGTENVQYAEFCKQCGYTLQADDWHSATTHQSANESEYAPHYTHYSAEHYSSADSIDDVASSDFAAIVGSNTLYYMPRFRRIANGESGGWNWSAFLFAPYWLFYRKQYLLGGIYLAVFLLMNVVSSVITFSIPVDVNTAAMDIVSQAMQNHTLFYPCMALMYIWLAMQILLGIKGNAFYFSHCKKKIGHARQKTPDISAGELSVSGGVSVGITVLIIMIARIGVATIAALLQNWFA